MRSTALAFAIAISSSAAIADDVEIYFNATPDGTGRPLVMLSLDYRSNLGSNICNVATDGSDYSACSWTSEFAEFNSYFDETAYQDGTIQFFDLLRTALSYVFQDGQLASANIQIGLMLNHDNIQGCENNVQSGCSNGGYIALGLTPLIDDGALKLQEKLAAIPTPQGNQSHSFQGKELYFELFRYLTGQGIYNGHVGYKDYGDPCGSDNLDSDTPSCVHGTDADYPDAAWDSTIESGQNYRSPFVTNDLACSSVHVVNFMFGASTQDSDSDSAIQAGKDRQGLDITLTGGTNKQFLQVINKLRDTDLADGTWGRADDLSGTQNVTSHFIFNGNIANTINGYAVAGGGKAIEVSADPRSLVNELTDLFLSVIKQTSTFEAPAVTVNSYNRLTHRDEVYYALFGPELIQDWPGNLKKYKFDDLELDLDGDGVTDKTATVIVDSTGQTAIDSRGLFELSACSFWSDCSSENDGDQVAAGGAAHRLGASRNVYTYTGFSANLADASNTLHEDNDVVTAEMLGIDVASLSESEVSDLREDLLRIGRGVDEDDPTVAIEQMGDPIHSRPAVIVFDGDLANQGANPDLSIALTTNEGYFHLIDADDGTEVFSFIPRELLPLIQRVNKEPVSGVAGQRFDTYGLDGSPVVLWRDANGDAKIDKAIEANDRVIVYLVQRRGGRNIYAVDITYRNAPRLAWHIQGGVTAGFDELGQTWSEPTLTKIRNATGNTIDVLVFGAGYDEDRYDRDANDPDDGVDIGRGVYVVNADTGQLIWSIGPAATNASALAHLQLTSMQDSVPAQIRALDIDDDAVMDRIYFSDIAGRVFRVDLNNTVTPTSIYGGGLIASLTDPSNCDWTATPNSCRRFYNSPDVAVMTGYPVSPYVQIAMGSGFRAHPKNTSTQDRFYVIYDQQVVSRIATADYSTVYGADGFTESSNLVNVTSIPGGSTYATAASHFQAQLLQSDKHGWYLDMDQSFGEKVVSESLTIGGRIIFTTYLPTLGEMCSAGIGRGRVYVVDAFNGLPVADLGGGLVTIPDINDPVSETHRYSLLPREGMPTDPTIIFKQKGDGTIEPNVVIGTQLPIDPSLLNINLIRKTWWVEE